jgi:DNA-binding CsgD family transcriptional regulator
VPPDHDDVSGILNAVRELAAVGDTASYPPVVLATIDTLIAADVSTYNEVNPVAGRIVWAARPATFTPTVDQLASFNAHVHEHPLIRYVQDTGDGSARRISDVLADEDFHQTSLYREFYGPLGVEYQMSVTLAIPSPTIVAIALNRRRADFTTRERRILDHLRPHLVQTWQQCRDRARLALLLATATEVVRAQGTRVLVLGDHLDELTPGTAVLLYRFFGRPGRNDPLPSRVASWVEAERGRLQGREPPPVSRSLSALRDNRRLTLRYLASTANHPEALIMSEHSATTPEGMRRFGLTAREAEILQLSGTGSTNAAMAARLHISSGTVKKHLDNIYRKLGVRSRIEALSYVREGLVHSDVDDS